ncbi:TonB-dependent receptor plug domain-containing protein [Pseudomarimonas salicorniae]|uniref:TonB-dependent receptor n=1 Tax=Pseudomarimonas salicorniae TaxID=2933270 RepID=A0ABT0GFQ4_9GAMM|nr:TonB-dependent receptor [Lysobacter sp. CAU 1642]MCK7593377.1 TonB-dependent receptor [Lysobacter sp. CAU 1642]
MRGFPLVAPLAIAFAVLLADSAAAQQPAMDRVEVTGSRIRKAMIEGQAPLHTLTRRDIERSGLSSVGDVLQQLTSSGSALNTRFNRSGNFGFPADSGGVGAGATTVDLRHLGCKRVLVLVDGVRWVAEASASGVSSCSDLNTLPLAIIERIDVLEDGASSIYGSDAVAGVINIITRRDIGGGRMALHAGSYEQGDGELAVAEASYGWMQGPLSVFGSVSHVDQNAVFSRDRELSAVPVPGTGVAFGSTATPDGRFLLRDPSTGALRDLTRGTGSAQVGPGLVPGIVPFSDALRYNFAVENLALTPSERDSVFLQGRLEIGERTSAYLRTLLNRRRSAQRAAPEPIFLGATAGTGNPLADQIVIPASHPFNPFGFDLDSRGDNPSLLLLARRPVEGGPREFRQEVDTAYLAFGLEGSFEGALSPWYWDVNLAGSRNRAEQLNTGSYNLRRINRALGPSADCAADPACVPLDLFGGEGSITPEMLAYIQPLVRDRSANDLQLFSANLSGDLLELWAGPLALATGVERRELDGYYEPDPITVAGDYNGVPSLPTRGDYAVNEAYVEANLPVFASAASQLDLSAALRYSDYTLADGRSTGRAGFRWQFGDNLLFRGTFAEGFRAPSIGELFGAASRFDAFLVDPCLAQPGGAPAMSDCAAFGVPAGAIQLDQQIGVLTGGNPGLDPEHSESSSLGLVYSPRFAQGRAWSQALDIELTGYRHRIDDAIQALDPQTQLDLCVEGGPGSPFCDSIMRAPAGTISFFGNRLQNFGRVETSGLDLHIDWLWPETRFGQGRLRWANSYVFHYREFDGNGLRQPRREGLVVNDSAIPEWTSVLQADWRRGDVELLWTARYIDAMEESCGRAIDTPACPDPLRGVNRLGSTTLHDLQLGWYAPWFDGARVAIGANNLFDRDPPACLSCSLNGYEASTYDLPGRFYYVRAEFSF